MTNILETSHFQKICTTKKVTNIIYTKQPEHTEHPSNHLTVPWQPPTKPLTNLKRHATLNPKASQTNSSVWDARYRPSLSHLMCICVWSGMFTVKTMKIQSESAFSFYMNIHTGFVNPINQEKIWLTRTIHWFTKWFTLMNMHRRDLVNNNLNIQFCSSYKPPYAYELEYAQD